MLSRLLVGYYVNVFNFNKSSREALPKRALMKLAAAACESHKYTSN